MLSKQLQQERSQSAIRDAARDHATTTYSRTRDWSPPEVPPRGRGQGAADPRGRADEVPLEHRWENLARAKAEAGGRAKARGGGSTDRGRAGQPDSGVRRPPADPRAGREPLSR